MSKSMFLKTAVGAVREAEKVILRYFEEGFEVEEKENLTPVTVADREAEETIKNVIKSEFPEHGFLGEEHGKEATDAEYVWIIDPIDGTKNFTRRLPFFATEIGLLRGEEFIIGISNLPVLKRLLYAEAGKGAYLNEEKIHVSDTDNIKDSFVSTGSFYRFYEDGLEEGLLRLFADSYHHRSFGDTWSYGYLAEGKLDIIVEPFINIWDIAAQVVIVEEAGGKVTDLKGNDVGLKTKSLLATNGLLHETVLRYFNEVKGL